MDQSRSKMSDSAGEMPTRITLVRHGHVHNPDNVIYGRLPGFRLSTAGRRQAKAAALLLRGANLSAVFTSPQQRTIETAEILQRHHPNLAIRQTGLVDEVRSYFEGHPAEEVEARGWDLYTGVDDGFEAPDEVGARGAQFVAKVRAKFSGQHVTVVTHGDVIAFTLLHAMHETVQVSSKRSLARFGITDRYPATASLTTLIYHSTDPEEAPSIEYVRPYDDDPPQASLS
jgi:broad specificity phosphatase PhoE